MVNLDLLNSTVNDSGLRVEFIAAQCGVSKQTIYNKLKGKTAFTAEEVSALRKVLRLNTKQTMDIFLL